MNDREDIGAIATGLGQQDADTRALSGELRDPALEERFRLWRYDVTLVQFKIAGWLILLAIIPFLWTTYRIYGPSPEFTTILITRALQFVVSSWALWTAYRRSHWRLLDLSALITGTSLLAVNALTLVISDQFSALAIVQALMVITAAYVLFPGRLISILGPLLLFSAFFIAMIVLHFDMADNHRPGFILWAVLANAIGYLAARQLNRFRRSEFMAMLRAEEDLVALKDAREEAEAARQEAQRANQAKSAMLANTSHELRTPLNAIIGFSEMMAHQLIGPIGNERYRQYAEDIHGSGRHLLALIDDLLDLSKIEAGKAELQPEWLAVRSMCEDVRRMIEPHVQAKRQQVAVNIDPAVDAVMADDRALRQVLVNLLTNAVKFSPTATTIELSATLAADGTAMIVVEDRGEGMDPEEIERLLQPFQQADREIDENREGWGLGLALVKALTDMQDIGFELVPRDGGGTSARLHFGIPLVGSQKYEPAFTASA